MTVDLERKTALDVLTLARNIIKGSNQSLLLDDGLEQLLNATEREEDFDLAPSEIGPTVVKQGETSTEKEGYGNW